MVVRELGKAIDDSGAEIVVGELPTVIADRGQLGQVFQNLIANAIKFHGDAAPRVEISAKRKGSHWEICVADNGVGIDPRHQDRIFTIFQRLHGRNEFEGSGIGLSIVKKIIERHGGWIRVESASGHGARFTFSLAAADESGGGGQG